MRIAPMVVSHLRHPSHLLWEETALCSAITHNDTASIASCVAFVAMLWDLLQQNEPPEPSWWVERFPSAGFARTLDVPAQTTTGESPS